MHFFLWLFKIRKWEDRRINDSTVSSSIGRLFTHFIINFSICLLKHIHTLAYGRFDTFKTTKGIQQPPLLASPLSPPIDYLLRLIFNHFIMVCCFNFWTWGSIFVSVPKIETVATTINSGNDNMCQHTHTRSFILSLYCVLLAIGSRLVLHCVSIFKNKNCSFFCIASSSLRFHAFSTRIISLFWTRMFLQLNSGRK